MPRYKLSIVVLVYNTEEYLRECLDSLVYQSLNDIEIIIVNDSSPDDSHVIIEEYKNKYSNIKVINQVNSGGAVAGNNGLKVATGEYVTIMDSDDIVPMNAYEKMYTNAIETNADIVIGKPNIIVNGSQKEIIYKRERHVWEKERIITDLSDYPEIFYDGFYWNKIYKKDLIFRNDCFMPPGMLYADRPMVHKAFLFADKISIITDVVYLWRKREANTSNQSITQQKYDINNLKDRIESLNYQIDYFEEYSNDDLLTTFLKSNIDRLFFPIKGILNSIEFREYYLSELSKLFSRIKDIYNNDLGITKNIYVFLIINKKVKELIEFVQMDNKGPIIQDKDKFYWALPYFRDERIGIPDSFFEVKELFESAIKIEEIKITNSILNFTKLVIPDSFKIIKVYLQLQSRINIGDTINYEFVNNGSNNYSLNINLDELHKVNLYDIYLVFYQDKTEKNLEYQKIC